MAETTNAGPVPPEDRARRFTILDALVLIAATSVGLAVIRSWTGPNPLDVPTPGAAADRIRAILASIALFAAPAVLFLRMLRPRPPLRQIGREAGTVACFAVTFRILIEFQFSWLRWIKLPPSNLNDLHNTIIGLTSVHGLAPSVVLAWIVLLFSGQWKPASDVVDRIGRAVGFAWLILYGQLLLQVYWDIATR